MKPFSIIGGAFVLIAVMVGVMLTAQSASTDIAPVVGPKVRNIQLSHVMFACVEGLVVMNVNRSPTWFYKLGSDSKVVKCEVNK